MSVPPERFVRVAGQVDLVALGEQFVIVVGVGTVGSQIAKELANAGVGHLLLIDGDALDVANLVRHTLPQPFVGMNKAEALTRYLSDEIAGLQVEAISQSIDAKLSDDALDILLANASLVVAATDDRNIQRRLGRRSLALDVPAVFPALYGDDGGEVVVQLDSRHPCFLCWDAFRPVNQNPRGVTALNLGALSVIKLASELCIGILDDSSVYARLLNSGQGAPQPQLFVQNRHALAIRPIPRRPRCPACAVGPAPLRQAAQDATPPTSSSRSRPPRRHRTGRLLIALTALLSVVLLIGRLISDDTNHVDHSPVPAKWLITGARIGRVAAHMTTATVKALLGSPTWEHRDPFDGYSKYEVPGGVIKVLAVYRSRIDPVGEITGITTNSAQFMTAEHFGVGSSISEIASVYGANWYQHGEAYAEYVPALVGTPGDPEISKGSRVFRYCPAPCNPGAAIEFSTTGESSRVAWVSVYSYFEPLS